MITRRKLSKLLLLPASLETQVALQQTEVSVEPLLRDLQLSPAELRQVAPGGGTCVA